MTGKAQNLCRLGAALFAAALAALPGCSADNELYMVASRLESGLVIILPGIEGESSLNHDLRRGLDDGGIPHAMPIQPWGRPIPVAGILINQIDILGNRLAALHVAQLVTAYQDSHPGKPVFLVGHSGGGGIAVFAAEALDENHKIDGLVLLSASISQGYNLTKALGNCRQGIVNFYSHADIGFLVIGTILAGNVDGMHEPSAGAEAFRLPGEDDPPEKKQAYARLYQVEITPDMTEGGSAHAGSTRHQFVRRYVAPWLLASSWPAGPTSEAQGPRKQPDRLALRTQRASGDRPPHVGKPRTWYGGM